MKLGLAFYEQDTLEVAQQLLGKIIVHEVAGKTLRARIVDCEAYPGINDKASHNYGNLRTKRTATLFSRPGHLYVYFIYGMHSLANVVCGDEDEGGGVMLRAVAPVSEADYEAFAENRFDKSASELSAYQRKNLTNGPGKLTQALQLDVSDNGSDLLEDRIYLEADGYSSFEMGAAPRVGIDYAEEDAELPYRFYIKGDPNVTIK